MLLVLGLVIGTIYREGPQPLTFIYEHWTGLITASLLMSVVQGIAVYAASFRPRALLALGGNSGNPIYDVCCHTSLAPNHTDVANHPSRLVLHWSRVEPVHRFL